MRLNVTGPFAEGVPRDQRNLVWQAARLAKWTGHIRLEKNLPHGAGIGGGSSDAAAVLRTFGGAQSALALGADVPVCLSHAPQRMRGIGEVLDNTSPLPRLEVVLVNPQVHVPTPDVFAALVQKVNAPMPAHLPEFYSADDFCQWLRAQRNDLEEPARMISPQIDAVMRTLKGALVRRMSGSGATCFGLYHAGAAQVAQRIGLAHPEWWVASGKLLS